MVKLSVFTAVLAAIAVTVVKSAPVITADTRPICVEYLADGLNADPNADYNPDDDNYDHQDEDDEDDESNEHNRYSIHKQSPVVNITGTDRFVECPEPLTSCFSLWKTDENGSIVVVRKGCWDNKQDSCYRTDCISDGPLPSKQHRFCCCTGNSCNRNFTSKDLPPSEITTVLPEQSTGESLLLHLPLAGIAIAAALLTLVAIVVVFFFKPHPKCEPTECAPLAPSGPGYSSNLHNVDNLKLCAMIGQGKYGTVWKGMVNDKPVAVKLFPSNHRQYFLNEKSIYTSPLMDCPSLLQYFGCDERRTLDDQIEYLLVLSLAPLGCLQDWLVENTTSFAVFCKMAKSVARGLSHLHTEIRKGDYEKPCICHRDLNSRNILIKSDLSCSIGDFGFALKTFGPRYEWKGEISLAETKSINEVGTLRYMAPEVLEGAVNLRDCETALKQIDVYSLGLVLWELCTRCHDWYPPGLAPPPYKSPYEAEIGKHPSFEQMQVLVSRHKARPLFPPSWGGGLAAKIARDTCEDCWDHDAEARLTALCAEERIHEMSLLKPRTSFQRGSSPPALNTNNLQIIAHSTQETVTPPNQVVPNHMQDETMVVPLVKNRAIFSQQIQPFQGRNPCQERNLAPTRGDPAVTFVEKSKKPSFVSTSRASQGNFANIDSDVNVEELIESQMPDTQSILGQGFPKQNNADRKLRGWHGVRALVQKKLFKSQQLESEDKSNLVENKLKVTVTSPTRALRTRTRTQIETTPRPSNLDLAPFHSEKFTLINNNFQNSNARRDEFVDRSFPVVLPQSPRIVVSKSANAVKNLNGSTDMSEERQLKRQRSMEVFREVFGSKGSIERLRDPSQRVKTPGDVPPSVRKVRASKTLSLYDDRMMDTSSANTL